MTELLNEKVDYLLKHSPLLSERIASAVPGRDSKNTLRELIKFLDICAVQASTPSILIDYAWHELILFTRCYQEFCNHFYGKFIHHSPDSSTEQNNKRYENTIYALKKEHFRVDKYYWPHGITLTFETTLNQP